MLCTPWEISPIYVFSISVINICRNNSFLLWQKICRRNLWILLVCQSSFDFFQYFAEPPDKTRPVPSLFDSDLWSQLTPDLRQSVFHLETVTTHWSVKVSTSQCHVLVGSCLEVFSNVIFWHPIDVKKPIFPGKSQLALKLKLILCLMMRETTMTAERRVPKFPV